MDRFEAEYFPLVERHLSAVAHTERGAAYVFGALRTFAEVQPHLARKLTLRHILQWCDYVRLQRLPPADEPPEIFALLNLALGGHVLLLDQLPPEQRAAAITALKSFELAFFPAVFSERVHAEPERSAGRSAEESPFARERWLLKAEGADGSVTHPSQRLE